MPIEVLPLEDMPGVLCWRVDGAWTIEDFYGAVTATQSLLATDPKYANVIVDASQATVRPKGNLLGPFRHALTRIKLDTVVYVRNGGGSKIIELLVNVVIRTNPKLSVKNFRFAKTMQEALGQLGVARI